MSSFNPIFPQSRTGLRRSEQVIEYIQRQRALHRILAFTGRTIDDVVNCRIAKNEVAGYFKLDRWMARESEIATLEKQWNSMRL